MTQYCSLHEPVRVREGDDDDDAVVAAVCIVTFQSGCSTREESCRPLLWMLLWKSLVQIGTAEF